MLYTLTDDVGLDRDIVKIVNSIAGGGKSTGVDKWCAKMGVKYLRACATNRQAMDSQDRQDAGKYVAQTDARTIASALFDNKDGYYAESKDCDADTIVIDEVLLTVPSVYDWIAAHRGRNNIIITCDDHQMLAPIMGKVMYDRLQDMADAPWTAVTGVTYSYRPVTDETRRYYDLLYKYAETDKGVHIDYLVDNFDTIDVADIDPTSQMIVTHTKEIEDDLYRMGQYSTRSDLRVIGKGRMSSSRHPSGPCISQLVAEKTKVQSYVQVANVGTCTRMQGSETDDLIYVVNPDSYITSRELYTTMTRCRDIRRVKIAIMPRRERKTWTTFCGCPVRDAVYADLDGADDKTDPDTMQAMMAFWRGDHPDKYVCEDGYMSGGKYHPTAGESGNGTVRGHGKMSIRTIEINEPTIDYQWSDTLYSRLDAMGIPAITMPVVHNHTSKIDYPQYVDLWSAYVTVMATEIIPRDGAMLTDKPHKGMINMYNVTHSHIIGDCMATDDLTAYITAHDPGAVVRYVCSVPAQDGCAYGRKLLDKAHGTTASKKSLKGLHWGIWMRPYIAPLTPRECMINGVYHMDGDDIVTDRAYMLHKGRTHELLIVAIMSQLAYRMLTLADAISNATGYGTAIVTDAVHYNPGGLSTDDIVRIVRDTMPTDVETGYSWRIKAKTLVQDFRGAHYVEDAAHKASTLYTSCPDVTDRSDPDKRRAQKAAWQAAYRARKKGIAKSV